MRILAILNLKGGVGKTTTTVNTAAILAKEYGQRVLLIDADAQCNLTEFYGGDPKKGNLSELLRDPSKKDSPQALIQATSFPGIDIIPGDESLMDLDLTKVELKSIEASVLSDLLCILKRNGLYDWVLIDCPPAFNAASCAALLAAEEVVIPIKLDAFSLRGMGNLSRQIANMRQINSKLRLGGVLPTMWYKSENIIAAEEQLRKSSLNVYPHIRRTAKVDDMTFAQQPLLISSPKSAAGKDYRAFVMALRQEGGKNNGI